MISIVFPVLNEEDNLEVLHARLNDVSSMVSFDFEFVFVDDCSTDKTPQILKRLHEKDSRVKVIRFARNCGSHAALAAGINSCKGDCAITLAADLQDPPEIIVDLLDKWKAGTKIVWGTRKKREGESLKTKLLARLYYATMNWLTSVKMPPLGTDVFLADRAVIEAFKKITEKHTSVFMALAWLGFSQETVPYVKEARHAGRSKWTLGKQIKLTIDSLLSFSDIPIRYMSVAGFLTAALGFFYALAVVLNKLVFGKPVEGWSSLMIVVLVVGGVQMTMLGVLGEYLWRTYDESRKRPRFVIEYTID